MITLSLAIRSLFRNKRRTLITVFAVACGVWGTVSLASLARGLSYGMLDDSIRTLTGHIQIHKPGFLDDPVIVHNFELSADLVQKLSNEKILGWAARLRVPAVLSSERESAALTLVGIDPAQEKNLSFIAQAVKIGQFFESAEDPGIIIGEKLAQDLETSLGKRIVVVSTNESNRVVDRGFKIVGIFKAKLESTEKSLAFVSLKQAQSFFALDAKITEIALLGKNEASADQLLVELTQQLPTLDIKSWRSLEPMIVALLKIQSGFILIWFVIVVVTVSFGLSNTIFMSVFERVREIGLMLCLGMQPRAIRAQVVLECLLLLLIGICLGNLISFATIKFCSSGIDLSYFSAGAELFGFSKVIYPRILFSDWWKANLLIVILGSCSSFYPAWMASRLVPVQALRKV